jgi:hypothetical protein
VGVTRVRDEIEGILRRVVGKADVLRKSRFVSQLVQPGYRIEFVENGTRVTRPDAEARDAFVLTLRFFLLQNEPTSFRALARLLDEPDVSDDWKRAFSTLRSGVNECLATAYGEYEYEGAKHRFSNRTILETFLNGGLVHANDLKAVARYEEWTRQEGLFDMLEFWFISTLQTLFRAIWYLSGICSLELKRADAVGSKTPARGSE